MTEAPVTEALRGLLVEGLTSAEIIARGYRPGTVYKVQRSLRLAAALASEPLAGAAVDRTENSEGTSVDPEDGFENDELEDEETTEDRVTELEAELSRVEEELRDLRTLVERRFETTTSRFSDVWIDLSRIKGQVPEMVTKIRWLREAAEDAITLLAPQTIKPADTWAWLVPPGIARNRIRRRLVEINPLGAKALFGDRIDQVMSAGLIETPPERKRWGERSR